MPSLRQRWPIPSRPRPRLSVLLRPAGLPCPLRRNLPLRLQRPTPAPHRIPRGGARAPRAARITMPRARASPFRRRAGPPTRTAVTARASVRQRPWRAAVSPPLSQDLGYHRHAFHRQGHCRARPTRLRHPPLRAPRRPGAHGAPRLRWRLCRQRRQRLAAATTKTAVSAVLRTSERVFDHGRPRPRRAPRIPRRIGRLCWSQSPARVRSVHSLCRTTRGPLPRHPRRRANHPRP